MDPVGGQRLHRTTRAGWRIQHLVPAPFSVMAQKAGTPWLEQRAAPTARNPGPLLFRACNPIGMLEKTVTISHFAPSLSRRKPGSKVREGTEFRRFSQTCPLSADVSSAERCVPASA